MVEKPHSSSTILEKLVYYRAKFSNWCYRQGECERCFAPSSEAGFLCRTCLQQLSAERPWSRTTLLQPAFDYMHCSYNFQPPLSGWIKAFKDQQQLSLLPRLTWLMLQRPIELQAVQAVLYIPSSPSKLLQRGFNPAELLARACAKEMGLPVLSQALIKHQSNDQRRLNRKQRLTNSLASLSARRLNLTGMHVLIIDDVLTTGATAQAAALALKQQGAAVVGVWALARTPWRH